MYLSKENENHLEEKKMKYSEILEIMSRTEFAINSSIVTKDVIDEWESTPDDQFDIEYDVEITEDEWADFCERCDRVARQIQVIKHLIEECGDEDEV